jgi:hypothetical protein
MPSKSTSSDKIFGLDPRLLSYFIPPVVELVVFLFVLNMVILPKITEIKDLSTNIKQTKTEVALVNEKKRYIDSVNLEDLRSKLLIVNDSLISHNDSYYLVNLIRNIAGNYNYEVQTFVINLGRFIDNENKDKVKKDVNQVQVQLSLVGPSEKYLELISAIENCLPILTIDEFEMNGSDAQVATIGLSVSSIFRTETSKKNLENLAIKDLMLTKTETGLLDTLTGYQRVTMENQGVALSPEGKEFIDYQRKNPFSF